MTTPNLVGAFYERIWDAGELSDGREGSWLVGRCPGACRVRAQESGPARP